MDLSLTDGTTTVQLNSGAVTTLHDAILRAPAMSVGQANDNPAAVGYENVTHDFSLLIDDSTAALVQTAARNIQKMLETARRRQATRRGPKVYLQIELDSDSETWRAEVLGGVLETDQALDQLRRPVVEALLSVICRAGWEGEEAELAISSSGYSAATGGRTITNIPASNWFQVEAAAINGVLPARCRVQLANTTGGNVSYRNFYVGNNAFADPDGLTYALEGEDRVTGYGTVVSDAAYSGGEYCSISIGTSQSIGIMWTLATATMAAGGRRFRALMRANGYTAGNAPHVQPMIYDNTGVTKLWEGQEIQIGDGSNDPELIDLGTIPLPPGEYDENYRQIRFALAVRGESATTLKIDYVQLMGTDGERHVKQTGSNLTNGSSAVFDEIDNKFYATNGLTKTPIYVPFRKGLWVFPGQQNRFHVLNDELNDAPIDHTMSARLYYRPRRLTI